jgi:hypothetical protein
MINLSKNLKNSSYEKKMNENKEFYKWLEEIFIQYEQKI